MQRFFKDEIIEKNSIILTGDDKNHIVKSLRMQVGELVVVCDGKLNDYVCEIVNIKKDQVLLKVLKKGKNKAEPTVKLHLYQAIPKLNKLEYIIQKSVELGVSSITPIISRRCVAILTKEKIQKKLIRFQKIAKQAAQQSGRGIIPAINFALKYEELFKNVEKSDLNIMFYEYGETNLNSIKTKGVKNINIIVGSEGGFEKAEVEFAKNYDFIIASLGNRILRCETASLSASVLLMYLSGNL